MVTGARMFIARLYAFAIELKTATYLINIVLVPNCKMVFLDQELVVSLKNPISYYGNSFLVACTF